MRNNLLITVLFAFLFIFYFGSTVSFAANTTYHITGYVVDINGNGIPGAKVSLFDRGFLVLTASTADGSPNTGFYSFDLDSLPSGEYQILGEKSGQQSSVMLKVSGSYNNYSAQSIALRNLAMPTNAQPRSTPTVVAPTPTIVPTPTVVVSDTAAPPVSTPEPTANATPLPTSSTPKPTPGIAFTLIPGLLVICLVALKKRD